MKIQKVRTIYFSSTGTTEKVLKSVIDGIGIDDVINQKIIKAENISNNDFLNTEIDENELVVFGVPVYS